MASPCHDRAAYAPDNLTGTDGDGGRAHDQRPHRDRCGARPDELAMRKNMALCPPGSNRAWGLDSSGLSRYAIGCRCCLASSLPGVHSDRENRVEAALMRPFSTIDVGSICRDSRLDSDRHLPLDQAAFLARCEHFAIFRRSLHFSVTLVWLYGVGLSVALI
jgi:hypothetical protein